ncbi:Drug resistance transporter, EmrB/QacA subfamily [Paraburkholderia caribensis]|uniref:MFS transporter n=1 Tax=Paraburkholderia caribensis TaxID=75105 RepID=UPI001CB2628C|nr:MFS transporter [Paraburkholderia caribensis]CAG9221644.1 Drug resistance transporter, EmrB/QacA subfamily [Paraburkholderia caribensis]
MSSTSPHPPHAKENALPAAWPIFWIASGAVFLVSLDTTMLYSVFESIRRSFTYATPASLSWVLNAYTIVYAAMLIPAGGFADAHGRKRVFLVGVLVFISASAACGMSPDIATLVGARVCQAIGAALLTPASLSLVLAAFPPSQRAMTVSMWGAVGGFAAAVGPSLGAYTAQTYSWRWAFLINVPVGAISLLLGIRLLAPTASAAIRRRVDVIGMALLIASVALMALLLVELRGSVWTNLELALIAGLSVGCLLIFVVWANKVSDPLIELSLFRNTTYAVVNLATLTFGIAFAMMFFAFFFYMTEIWHFDSVHAGFAIIPGPLTVIPVAIATGRLAGRYGYRRFLVSGSLLYAVTGTWFYFIPGVSPEYGSHWLPGLLISGASVGLVMPSLAGAAVSRLPVEHYAVGSAVNQATRQMGAVIGVAIVVMLLGHGIPTRASFDAVYGTHIALALITALLCAFVRERRND